jgi:hypothetical protein
MVELTAMFSTLKHLHVSNMYNLKFSTLKASEIISQHTAGE